MVDRSNETNKKKKKINSNESGERSIFFSLHYLWMDRLTNDRSILSLFRLIFFSTKKKLHERNDSPCPSTTTTKKKKKEKFPKGKLVWSVLWTGWIEVNSHYIPTNQPNVKKIFIFFCFAATNRQLYRSQFINLISSISHYLHQFDQHGIDPIASKHFERYWCWWWWWWWW